MAELKTQPTDQDVDRFLDSIADEQRREDCRAISEMMREASGDAPRMWGDSIVGFGRRRYRYASGREGDWFLTGFSPRKQNLTLYLWYGFEQDGELLQRLGKHKIGKACLYIKRLSDLDRQALRELIDRAAERKIDASADESAAHA